MKYTFSPATDFEKLAAAIAGLYGSAAGRQIPRYQALLQGLEEHFGPYERATTPTTSTAGSWPAASTWT